MLRYIYLPEHSQEIQPTNSCNLLYVALTMLNSSGVSIFQEHFFFEKATGGKGKSMGDLCIRNYSQDTFDQHHWSVGKPQKRIFMHV